MLTHIYMYIYIYVQTFICTGNLGSIPALGRSPGEGKGYPLHYPYLENSMDKGAWQVQRSL